MFKKDLQEKLSRIFGIKKVTFDEPGESYEQDTLFVEIQEAPSNAGQGTVSAKVRGSVVLFSQRNKLPYGYFNKKISQAAAADKKDLFFFDIDVEALNSPARIQNISERRTSFVYLYSAQYDPAQGELKKLTFEEEGA